MRKIVALILLLFVINFAFAQKVNISDAELLAKNVITERSVGLTKSNENFKIDYSYTETYNGTDVFHVFNLKPQGFVIISAQKSVEPVLGFSFNSTCPKNERNPSISWWFENYAKQIEYMAVNNIAATEKVAAEWTRLQKETKDFVAKSDFKTVSQLLNTTWNQGRYFNAACPQDPAGTDGRVVVGCVATALGQLMNYFRYPETGTGSYGYEHPTYGWLEVNFAEQNYNFDQMPINPTDYNDDIARLLYNIGVSVDMNYGPDGSGMYNHKGAYTLATYFGYNPATTYLFRDSLPEDFDWNGTLVNHLDQNIPLYYAGWSDYEFIGGHAFIFDGYSDSTHYHINWGWGGSADGYFYINNLTPSGNNFTLLHEVIVNAVPSTEPTYCNGLKTLNTIEGIIEDGSGPLDFYQNDADCEWLISPQDSVSGITLEFLKLVMDDEDYIIIYNGNSSSSPILETIYGSDNPTIIESTSDKVFIKFVSNADSVNDGWLLSYAGIKPKYCLLSDTFTAITDTIVDGSNSYQYQNNTFCNWYIQPAEAQSIRISFLEFDIEPVNDFVKIVNSSNQTVATLSGSVIPDPVTIIGDKATVTFRSNTSSRNNGFKLYYEINKDAIDQNKIAKVSLFPNPAEDQIFIDLSNISGATKIKIINCDGKICNEQIIDTQNNTLQNIDISELSAGLYIVVIENNQYVGRLKMVKKK